MWAAQGEGGKAEGGVGGEAEVCVLCGGGGGGVCGGGHWWVERGEQVGSSAKPLKSMSVG